MNKWKIIETEDGSKTLFNSHLNESYHSRHGALQESQHVFIKNGFAQLKKKSNVRIFEMGFGTGLNVFVTAKAMLAHQTIEYQAIDTNPLDVQVTQELDYGNGDKLYELIHNVAWNQPKEILPQFSLTKYEGSFLKHVFTGTYDLIYYDAFAPDVQPELWSEEIWQIVKQISHEGTIFVTYCAKGSVRRGLEAVGFKMERLEGPPGKREMLRGILGI